MKQIENLAPLFSFPMFLLWLIFGGFLKIASDVLFTVCIVFLVLTVKPIVARCHYGLKSMMMTNGPTVGVQAT